MRLSSVAVRAGLAARSATSSALLPFKASAVNARACARPACAVEGAQGKGLKQRGAERVWHAPVSGTGADAGGYRAAGQRAQHSRAHEHSEEKNAQRGTQWIVCGAGVLAGFAYWQSQQHVLAEAGTEPSLAFQGFGGGSAARMSEGQVQTALASSDAATLQSALASLILLAEDDDVDSAQNIIAQVASKRILGHPEGSVRAAAVCALSALVATDDKAAAASLASLVKGGAVAACQHVLADKGCTPELATRAASLLAALSAVEGGLFGGGAHKSAGYMEAVSELARLASEQSLGADARLAVVGALGKILDRKVGGGVGSSGDTAEATIGALSLILMPSRKEDQALMSAALQALAAASHHASLLPLVISSPTSEHVLGMATCENLADATAALQTMKRMVKTSTQVAERLCIDSAAVQLIVQAATTHRASKEMREAVASCMEALIASNSDDCRMRVSHFATPVAIALARVSDEEMQVRALRMVRTLSTNGFNKFNMQKSFSVIHELVPFLVRSDVRQQELVTESLAHLASTDNAYYGENARALGEARAMKPLMVLARSKNHVVHRNATWALASMTACERNHVPMRASIDTLLAVVTHGSRDAQRYAVMAISNLAATDRTREMLKERGTEAILRQCAQANSGDAMLTSLVNRTALINLKRNGTQVFNIPPPAGL